MLCSSMVQVVIDVLDDFRAIWVGTFGGNKLESISKMDIEEVSAKTSFGRVVMKSARHSVGGLP